MQRARYTAAVLALLLSAGLAVGCDTAGKSRENTPSTLDGMHVETTGRVPATDVGTGMLPPEAHETVVPETAPTVTIPSEPVVGEIEAGTVPNPA